MPMLVGRIARRGEEDTEVKKRQKTDSDIDIFFIFANWNTNATILKNSVYFFESKKFTITDKKSSRQNTTLNHQQ